MAVLKGLAGDEDRPTRAWAAYALARITGDAKPHVAVLIDLWEDGLGEPASLGSARHDVVEALSLLGADARPAKGLLLDFVLDDDSPAGTRGHAARAVAQLTDDAAEVVPKLVALIGRATLRGFRGDNRLAAAEALGQLGPRAKDAVPHLRRLLADGRVDVADAAARAIHRITGE